MFQISVQRTTQLLRKILKTPNRAAYLNWLHELIGINIVNMLLNLQYRFNQNNKTCNRNYLKVKQLTLHFT